MPIILYYIELSPPARAVFLTAEALGLKLEGKIVDLTKGEHLTPEYIKLNPQHTVPTLDDNGTVIWDSHAIMAYLVRKYAKNDTLYPKDFVKRAVVDQRLHFDTGVAFGALRTIVRKLVYKKTKSMTEDDVQSIEEIYDFLEKFLATVNSKWIAGTDQATIADFSLVTTVTSANAMHAIDSGKYPKVLNWIKNVESLPCYKVEKPRLKCFQDFFATLVQ